METSFKKTNVYTLDSLSERDDRESELWSFVKRPSGLHASAQRAQLLRLWRQAKRLALREEKQLNLQKRANGAVQPV